MLHRTLNCSNVQSTCASTLSLSLIVVLLALCLPDSFLINFLKTRPSVYYIIVADFRNIVFFNLV